MLVFIVKKPFACGKRMPTVSDEATHSLISSQLHNWGFFRSLITLNYIRKWRWENIKQIQLINVGRFSA